MLLPKIHNIQIQVRLQFEERKPSVDFEVGAEKEIKYRSWDGGLYASIFGASCIKRKGGRATKAQPRAVIAESRILIKYEEIHMRATRTFIFCVRRFRAERIFNTNLSS
jgi:hypothetical protein